MQIDVDITKPDCQYKECRYWRDGKCINDNARKECLDIALSVLNSAEKTKYNIHCDFCCDLAFAETLNDERCEKYNKTDTIGKAVGRRGVRFITYITDARKRYYEKASKTYKLLYCPLCGRKLNNMSIYQTLLKKKK